MSNYFLNIWKVSKTLLTGMNITLRYFRHFKETVTTVQYPHELEMVADRHRGVHYLETEKCIMCDLCAKVCPVTCIDISGSRDGEFEDSFEGSKAWMSKFTIDYGECLVCNLCIEVCPKDCIHMKPKKLLEGSPAGYEGTTGHDNVRFEFDFCTYRREDLVKNLLTDQCFTTDDLTYVQKADVAIEELTAETKRKKAEDKAKRLAAKKAAEQKKASAESPDAGSPEEKPRTDESAEGTTES